MNEDNPLSSLSPPTKGGQTAVAWKPKTGYHIAALNLPLLPATASPHFIHCYLTFLFYFIFFATTCIKSFLKSVPDSCPQPVLHFSFRLRPARGNNRCRNRWCHGKEKGMIFSSWRVNWAMWLWRGELLPLVLDHHGTLFQKEMCKNFNR